MVYSLAKTLYKRQRTLQFCAYILCLLISCYCAVDPALLFSRMKTAASAFALLGALPSTYAWGSPPFGQWGRPQSGPDHHGSPPHHGRPAWTSTSSAASAPPSATQDCTALTSDEIQAAGNNSLFTRWRPYSHVLAPAGWMNDPCAPIEAKALGPAGNGTYDGLGIFSGTGQPVNLKGEVDGTLLLMYTSVSWLPTSWAIPYHPGTETTSLALSTDGGKTWEQYEGNPIIDATTETAPMYWNLTGFRDPFFQPWPAMDELLDVSEPHYYAVYGSGIKGVGPRIPFWTAPASDLTSWKFLGALWEPADNTTLGPLLSTGTYGFNFEVSGFFSLPDRSGDLHYFVNMGSEGGNVSFHESAHWSLWNEGTVTRRSNGSAQFTPIAGGAGDWGLSYALTSFNDTKHNRRVQWAWAPEDLVGDGGLFSASQQGFQGSLTFPRELFVHEVDNVVNDGTVAESKNAALTKEANGLYTAQTLGVRPLADVVEALHAGATYHSYDAATYHHSELLVTQASSHMHLRAVISSSSSNTAPFGLTIAASPDAGATEATHILYSPTNHTILVDRAHSSTIDGFANSTVTGYFAPYTLHSPASNTTAPEPLVFDVFVDGSLVEIYLNDRFALTTRVYPSMLCSTGFGVYVADGARADVAELQAWVGLREAWPQRPRNSSSPLLWDTPEETNDYTWWAGN
nr:fructan 6-exohydrolase [Quercus suber]